MYVTIKYGSWINRTEENYGILIKMIIPVTCSWVKDETGGTTIKSTFSWALMLKQLVSSFTGWYDIG